MFRRTRTYLGQGAFHTCSMKAASISVTHCAHCKEPFPLPNGFCPSFKGDGYKKEQEVFIRLRHALIEGLRRVFCKKPEMAYN